MDLLEFYFLQTVLTERKQGWNVHACACFFPVIFFLIYFCIVVNFAIPLHLFDSLLLLNMTCPRWAYR